MSGIDLNEHLKILFVALSAVAAVVTVGLYAESGSASSLTSKQTGLYLSAATGQPGSAASLVPVRVAHR